MPKVSHLSPQRRPSPQDRAGVGVSTVLPGEVRRLPNALGQAALLEWLGQAPISFHRVYVDLAGGVLPALWLSSAMDRVAKAHTSAFDANGDYVFSMSSHECHAATGITRAQQASCRRHLIQQGLLSEQSTQRKTTVYRLHLDRIVRRLISQSAPLADRLQTYEPLPELPRSVMQRQIA